MTFSNAAGDPVSLLNPFDGGPVKYPETEDQDHRMTDDGMPLKASPDMRRWKLSHQAGFDHTEQSRRDDVTVQEQTLDLLRNMICGDGSADMIDYLLREFGQSDFLEILADKLRPKPFSSSGRRGSTSAKAAAVPAEILIATTYILIHLAAGSLKQRNLVVNHRELVPLMLPLFNHPSVYVRTNCVWFVINLTFTDDQAHRQGCIERAQKLRAFGVMERLISLEKDSEVDVRERISTALALMRDLLGL